MQVSEIIDRADGSQVKIVAEEGFGIGLHRSIGVYVLSRADKTQPWQFCNERPDPNWKTMSVADYVKNGRSKMLQTVRPCEILRVAQQLESAKTWLVNSKNSNNTKAY